MLLPITRDSSSPLQILPGVENNLYSGKKLTFVPHTSAERKIIVAFIFSFFVITKITQTVLNRFYVVQIFLLCSYSFGDIFSSF